MKSDDERRTLVPALIDAAVYAFNENDRLDKFEDLRFTSLTVALIAQRLIDMGWPAVLDTGIETETTQTGSGAVLSHREFRYYETSETCAAHHHQACAGVCGCKCHPITQRRVEIDA